jgi:hypothetical protein
LDVAAHARSSVPRSLARCILKDRASGLGKM